MKEMDKNIAELECISQGLVNIDQQLSSIQLKIASLVSIGNSMTRLIQWYAQESNGKQAHLANELITRWNKEFV
jgi:hypothetical protein